MSEVLNDAFGASHKASRVKLFKRWQFSPVLFLQPAEGLVWQLW